MERPFAYIVDRMSDVQIIKGDNLIFNELPDQIFASIFRSGNESEHTDVIFGVYQQELRGP